MSSTLRVSVGRCFGRARLGVSRARAVAPAALAALVPAARRPVRVVLPLVVLVSVAAAVVRVALARLAVVVGVALPLADVPVADVPALARRLLPSAPARPAVPPSEPLVFDPLLLVATANLLARLPALWRRRRPLPVVYPQVVRS